MNPQYQKEFLQEQHIEFQALQALLQKKNEIRINFSKSKAYRQLQMEIKTHPNGQILNLVDRRRQPKAPKPRLQPKLDQQMHFESSLQLTPSKDEEMFEVIKRQNNRLAGLGRCQDKPLMRNSIMSRTFRKKKCSEKGHSFNFFSCSAKKPFTFRHTIDSASDRDKLMFVSQVQLPSKGVITPTKVNVDFKGRCEEQQSTPHISSFKQGLASFSKEEAKNKNLFLNKFKVRSGKSHPHLNCNNHTVDFASEKESRQQFASRVNQSFQADFIHQGKAPYTARRKRSTVKVSPPEPFRPKEALNLLRQLESSQPKKLDLIDEELKGSFTPWAGSKNSQQKQLETQQIQVTPQSPIE